jgi:hypothetical protein
VLFAWNDRLDTNLSLVGSYFGDHARTYLDGLYEDFTRVGQEVEAVVRAARSGQDTSHSASQVVAEFEAREPGSLNDRVYQFGLMLMGQLREGRVGRYAPNKSIPDQRADSRSVSTSGAASNMRGSGWPASELVFGRPAGAWYRRVAA